jgi:hypothetical protein
MIDEIREAIDAIVDEAARPRLRACLPMLQQGLSNWRGARPSAHALVIAAATPASCIVFDCRHGWPTDLIPIANFDKGEAALATVVAIESAPTAANTDRILTGLCVVLGSAGIAAQQADAARIIADGGMPLVVALLERQAGSITGLVTTVTSGERERTLH